MRRLLLLSILSISLLISCLSGNYFEELEQSQILTSPDLSFSSWNVEYDVTTSFDYLVAVDIGSTSYTTTGLDDTTSTVFRLELVNLMNDGGFESGTATGNSIDGGGTGGVPTGAIEAGVVPNDIAGNVYHFDIPDPEDRIDFNLNSYLSGFSSDGNYVLRFGLKSLSSNIAFEQWPGEAGDQELWSLTISTFSSLYLVPEAFTDYVDSSFTYNSTGTYFTIGKTAAQSPIQEGYIDNLRVGRTDTGAALAFRVPFNDLTGSRPDLLSGYYRFSIKVLNDPEISPNANGLNRMASENVTLSVKSLQNELNNKSYYETFEPESSSGWTSWTKVYLETGSIQIDNSGNILEPVLLISVVPTNTQCGCHGFDVGSVLISEPYLEYSADGSFD